MPFQILFARYPWHFGTLIWLPHYHMTPFLVVDTGQSALCTQDFSILLFFFPFHASLCL